MAIITNKIANNTSRGKTETERLQALYEYKILETLPEKEFDEITSLAGDILNAKTAKINLLYEDIQWSKSIFDVSGDVSLNNLPRKKSVCQYTIQTPKVLEIPDLTKDERTKSLPYVKREPFYRYYLGAPLITPDGHAIGALCVLDNEPRYSSQRKKNQLVTLASQVMNLMEIHKQNLILQKHNESQKKLMKILSHDLRSPLNGIIGLSELLITLSDDNNSEQRSMLKNILLSSKKLNQMVNDILNYSFIEEGGFALHKKETNIREIAEDIIELHKPSAQLKEIQLTLNIDSISEPVMIDPEKFEQIMGNLVSNAIKFTETGGAVICSISPNHFKQKSGIQLTVEDNGIGMNQDEVDRLLNSKKLRHQTGTSGEKGSGLGFPIIREFTKLHNGEIEIESEPGKGTTITIYLPAEN